MLKIIDKRAKKNMLTISEQIDDILRRSCINAKTTTSKPEKLDDTLISLFSRKKK
jgi:Txe/YoeB family toxin of Txe-Axe toxin-antitoxin module